MLSRGALSRPDLGDSRTRLAMGLALMGALIAAFVYAIGTGDVRLTVLVAVFAVAPALLVLALKRSYLFPYGIYVVLIPFDNMLKISGSGTVTKLLGIVSTVFVIVYAFRRKGLSTPPLSLYFWLAYLGWLVLSLLWTVDFDNGMIDMQQTFSLIAMYAVLAVAPLEERDLRAICTCIILGGVASSFYGMYLLHDQPAVAAATGEAARLMINVDNRTIDANHFANAMLTPIALAMVALLNSRKPAIIVGSIAALAVLFAGELMSLSREAMLACAIIIAITVWYSRRRVLGFVLGAGIIGLIPVFVPSIMQRLTDAFVTGGAGRTSIWSVGWAAYKQHPVFGWGAGGSVEAYDRYFLRVFQPYNTGWSRPPHNTPLQIAIELGIVGLVILIGGYFATFRQFRGIERGDSLYDMRIAFTASLIGARRVRDVHRPLHVQVLLDRARDDGAAPHRGARAPLDGGSRRRLRAGADAASAPDATRTSTRTSAGGGTVVNVAVAVGSARVPQWHAWCIDALRREPSLEVSVFAVDDAPAVARGARIAGAARRARRDRARPAPRERAGSDRATSPAARSPAMRRTAYGDSCSAMDDDLGLPFGREVASGAGTYETELVRRRGGRTTCCAAAASACRGGIRSACASRSRRPRAGPQRWPAAIARGAEIAADAREPRGARRPRGAGLEPAVRRVPRTPPGGRVHDLAARGHRMERRLRRRRRVARCWTANRSTCAGCPRPSA